MAEIPIEKKGGGGMPWWVWLILAVLIVALLIWLFADDDRDEVRPVDQTTVATVPAPGYDGMDNGTAATTAPGEATGAAAGGDAITDLATLLGADAAAVAGREVRLTDVPAGAVPSDAGFWIEGPNGQREYAVIHEVRTPNTPIEGRIDVNEGDRLDITGTVRSAERGVPSGAAIPPPTDPLPAGVNHYIEVQTISKR